MFRSSRSLLLCLTIAVGILSFAPARRANAAGDSASLAEQYLLAAANQERAARGISPVHRDPSLARAAAQHARAMAAHGTISHQFAGEPELTERGSNAGVPFSAISENVGEAPSVVTIHDLWMHSEHHRTNLLDPSVDSVGISVVARGGELYATEDFAKTVRSVSVAEQESAIANLILQPGRIELASNSDAVTAARQTCTMSTGFAGARKPWFVMRFTSDSLNQLPAQLTTRLNSGRYREAAVGACPSTGRGHFTSYSFAVLLYP